MYEAEGVPRGRGVWRYKDLLPRLGKTVISLGEGSTPLVELPWASESTGAKVYGKLEGLNPTGSFKDRGMTVGVSIAKGLNAKVTVVASTGNTAASMAAYSRRAGLKPVILLPRGGVAKGKLLQALAHGATLIEVEGGFDHAMEAVLNLVSLDEAYIRRVYPLNSFNPYRLEGQKTIAFEVLEDLGEPPDYVIVPVGNSGNIAAIWKGFKEAGMLGLPEGKPKMIGVQAEGASPLADAWALGLREPLYTHNPRTVASAIRIGRPVNWQKALKAVDESRGAFLKVSDEEILKAMATLASEEGVIVEPASAAAYAGLLKAHRIGMIERNSKVVLVLTGHGLKDPDTLSQISLHARIERASNPQEALEAIEDLARE
ncbi:MAG: threonine synthase [Desulfurococcales archaeon]|nr:threonine synthase [Desulfurococcales archaeon]